MFLDYVRRNGTDWSQHPACDDVTQEYNRIWSLVGKRKIEDLIDLPLLVDPDVLDMLDVFTEIVHPAMFFDENLSTLVVFRMVSLCLEHGNCDASCFGFVWFRDVRWTALQQSHRWIPIRPTGLRPRRKA